jgi:hypothetical protein
LAGRLLLVSNKGRCWLTAQTPQARHPRITLASPGSTAAHLDMREVAFANPHDHCQLLFAEHDLLVIVLVIDGP